MTQQIIYVTPSGETAIVKDIRLWNANTLTAVPVQLGWRIGAGFRTFYGLSLGAQTGNPPQDNPFWMVLPPGGEIFVNVAAVGPIDILISGAELVGVA